MHSTAWIWMHSTAGLQMHSMRVCSAGVYGGALAIDGNGYTLSNITGSVFTTNTATQAESSPSDQITSDGGEPRTPPMPGRLMMIL